MSSQQNKKSQLQLIFLAPVISTDDSSLWHLEEMTLYVGGSRGKKKSDSESSNRCVGGVFLYLCLNKKYKANDLTNCFKQRRITSLLVILQKDTFYSRVGVVPVWR